MVYSFTLIGAIDELEIGNFATLLSFIFIVL